MNSDREKNCISFIKLLAALQVMLGHIVMHLKLSLPRAVSSALFFYNGVPIFFIISGYLIWSSIERSSSYLKYISKRFWRIYPELWIAVATEVITIVVLYSGWNFRDLFAFSITQGSFLQFWTPDSLRGYGCGTPNGTLWTICVMIQFYIISWSIYKFFHRKSVGIWIIGLIAFILLSIAGQSIFEKIGIIILEKLYSQTVIKYCWLFFFGGFIAENKEKILQPFFMRYWYVFLIVALISYLTDFDFVAGYKVFHSVLLLAGLIGFAYEFPRFAIKTDISYGIFLYHMIIVNIFIHFGLEGKWIFAFVVIILTVAVAYISTKTIGVWSAHRKAICWH